MPRPEDTFRELTFRPYESGDETEILDSFNRVFGKVDPNFQPREVEFWRWQFLDNPSTSPVYVALTEEGKVAGHMGGVCQRMRTEYGPTRFMQGVDHFSDPSLRRTLRRGSLMAEVGKRQAEVVRGSGPDDVALMWGPPVPAAWRVGKSMLNYDLVRTQLKLWCAPVNVRVAAHPGVEIEEVSEFPEEVVELWERAAEPYGAIAVRDKAQLDWRYRDRPGGAYRIALARRGAELVGYTVYTRGDFDHQTGEGLICDWLVPPGEEGAGHALRGWLAEVARHDDVPRLVFVIPDSAPPWIEFQHAGFRAAPSIYFIIARIEVKRFRTRWLQRRWYYTLGDTDLV